MSHRVPPNLFKTMSSGYIFGRPSGQNYEGHWAGRGGAIQGRPCVCATPGWRCDPGAEQAVYDAFLQKFRKRAIRRVSQATDHGYRTIQERESQTTAGLAYSADGHPCCRQARSAACKQSRRWFFGWHGRNLAGEKAALFAVKLTEVSFGKLAVSLSRDNVEEEGGSLMNVQNKAPEIRLSAQMVDNTHLTHDVRTPRHFDKTKQRN